MSIACGVIAALLAVEVVLRAFASPLGPPTPNVSTDSLVEDTIVRREVREGVSVARFSISGARLTGNAQIPTAPTVVLLGDSYVVAEAVSDVHTMGSYLERNARAAGVPLNVRQYGWTGASPSRYLMVGDSIVRRWKPVDVVIALSDNDLDREALYEARPQLRVTRGGDLEILPGPPEQVGGGSPRQSTLRALLEERTWKLEWRRARAAEAESRPASGAATRPDSDAVPDSLQLSLLPGAVVRALHAKFGAPLALIYLAEVGVEGGDSASAIEVHFLEACRASQVRCATTRPAMIAARHSGILAHGFFNTTPGNGHLNAAGHAIAGTELWKLLRRHPQQTFAGEVR